MIEGSSAHWGRWLVLLALLTTLSCKRRSEVVIFCAASLHAVLTDAAAEFERDNPGIKVRLEPSGSLVAARKITELGMRADIIAVADVGVIDRMLVPTHASWSLVPVTNAIVLAHKDHSHFTDEVTTDNWSEVLVRAPVRLGCTNPDTAPLGYRTLFVWQLAEPEPPAAPALAERLREKCAAENIANDENALVALLEARAIDYAFLYRSTAETHHLKTTELGAAVNLSRPELAEQYARAAVEVGMAEKAGMAGSRFQGAPIAYGMTILNAAANPGGARRFLAFLLGEAGHRHFTRMGFGPLTPAPCHHTDQLPAALRGLVVSAP